MNDLIDQLEQLVDSGSERVKAMFLRIRQQDVQKAGAIGFLIGTLMGLRYRVDSDTRQVIDRALEKMETETGAAR